MHHGFMSKRIWPSVVCFLLGLACIVWATNADARDFHLVDLNELGINYRNYAMLNDKARVLLLGDEHPKEGINVLMKFDVLKYGYLDSQIESLTTNAQYRSIGLQLRLGMRVSDFVELGVFHHSQHVLDKASEGYAKFPVEDAVELRIYLYRSKESRRGIF